MNHPLTRTRLVRSTRKSFTLLELMVAFIIMAILSAVAIPSLIGVVGNDQLQADSTSAGSIVDAAYYNAVSEAEQSSPAVVLPLTATEVESFIPAGTDSSIYSIIAGEYGDPTPALQFTFTDGDVIYVSNPQSASGSSPSVLGGTSSSGGVIGGGSDGTGGGPSAPGAGLTSPGTPAYPGGAAPSGGEGGGAGTTTTSTTTTTTTPSGPDGSSCSEDYTNGTDWTINCSGIVGPTNIVYVSLNDGFGSDVALYVYDTTGNFPTGSLSESAASDGGPACATNSDYDCGYVAGPDWTTVNNAAGTDFTDVGQTLFSYGDDEVMYPMGTSS